MGAALAVFELSRSPSGTMAISGVPKDGWTCNQPTRMLESHKHVHGMGSLRVQVNQETLRTPYFEPIPTRCPIWCAIHPTWVGVSLIMVCFRLVALEKRNNKGTEPQQKAGSF